MTTQASADTAAERQKDAGKTSAAVWIPIYLSCLLALGNLCGWYLEWREKAVEQRRAEIAAVKRQIDFLVDIESDLDDTGAIYKALKEAYSVNDGLEQTYTAIKGSDPASLQRRAGLRAGIEELVQGNTNVMKELDGYEHEPSLAPEDFLNETVAFRKHVKVFELVWLGIRDLTDFAETAPPHDPYDMTEFKPAVAKELKRKQDEMKRLEGN